MLILTRRVGEKLFIGDRISLTILGVRGNQIRVGIDAPREVAVHRSEAFDRTKEAGQPVPAAENARCANDTSQDD